MKLFPTLASGLCFYFGLARSLAVLFAALWLMVLTVGPFFQKRLFTDNPKLMISVGEVSVQSAPNSISLNSDTATTHSLELADLRGRFNVDLLTSDAALASALRWTVIPNILVLTGVSWLLLTALRKVCWNIACRDVFTESNLRLVRNIGFVFIAYSVTQVLTRLWSAYVMNGYLRQHVTVSGMATGTPFPGGLRAARLSFASGFLSVEASLVAGCLVLVLCEAFRRGLALKTENDLTV